MSKECNEPQHESKLEILKWMIEKEESLRTNNIARAGVMATVAAIVIGAYSFLSQRTSDALFRVANRPYELISILYDMPVIIGMALSILGLFKALDAILHLSKHSAKLAKLPKGSRIFFHSGDTVEAFKSSDEFAHHLANATDHQLQTALQNELWGIHCAHAHYLGSLRVSARLILAATVVLMFQYVAVALLQMLW